MTAAIAANTTPAALRGGGSWDARYEWRVVLLLSLSFGLVGLDRWILGPLFPAIMADLHLDYGQLGTLVGGLGIAWGVFAILIGNLSDRIGRRAVLLPALVVFSALSGAAGLATGFVMLLLARTTMGAAEGAFLPASVAATAEASLPMRRGLNQGLQLGAFALFGFGIAPIVATQLLQVLPSWREVFMIVAIPGFILAFLLNRVLRDAPRLAVTAPRAPWTDVIKSRNVILGALCLLAAMSCIFVLGAMVPNYLVDFLHLTPVTMGLVMSGMGWGGFLGEFMVAGISDRIGRRPATALAFLGAAVGTWFFAHAPADPWLLFGWLSVTAFFALGLTSILAGPVASEAVSPALMSSSVGVVAGAGEIFGGGIAPVIAGFVAQHYGIAQIFVIPLAGLAIGLALSLFLRETAPRRERLPGHVD
ncbi:MFS transporter (plasmid) [Polymorphobacter sp. PAMC 29334]|uniref:MFS transporter n=1 Tax=Polymorphobacter sp. PAMC 29334 TaxID=2862331 RepID=UPI001C78AE50|nr:MFS transporter [Polymorphobacter sp. PAMC 29334]QYE33541.1 MFS transporter [Polymorphobacter sp. PAMC 29334]